MERGYPHHHVPPPNHMDNLMAQIALALAAVVLVFALTGNVVLPPPIPAGEALWWATALPSRGARVRFPSPASPQPAAQEDTCPDKYSSRP